MMVTGLSAREIGEIANKNDVPLYELSPQSVSLEEAFMELTRDAVEYASAAPSSGKAA